MEHHSVRILQHTVAGMLFLCLQRSVFKSICIHVNFINIAILTVDWLAQLLEHWPSVQEIHVFMGWVGWVRLLVD